MFVPVMVKLFMVYVPLSQMPLNAAPRILPSIRLVPQNHLKNARHNQDIVVILRGAKEQFWTIFVQEVKIISVVKACHFR